MNEVLAVLACVFVIASGIANLRQDDKINDLRARVACLERPHGESSIAGRFVGSGSSRRFVVTQAAHRTGCK